MTRKLASRREIKYCRQRRTESQAGKQEAAQNTAGIGVLPAITCNERQQVAPAHRGHHEPGPRICLESKGVA